MKFPTLTRRFAWPALLCAGTLLARLSVHAAPVYTLEHCLDLTAKQNPDVVSASKRVDAAHAVWIQARAGVLPLLTSSGYYQRREQSVATNGGTSTDIRPDDYFLEARLAQNLFSSGAVRNRIAAAELGERIAVLERQTVLDSVSLAVREAFYTTLAAEQSIGVRQQAVDLLGSQLKDQQDRLAAGLVGQVNVNRAQVALANEQPALLASRSSVRTSYAALSQLLGTPYPADAAEAPFRVSGTLGDRPFTKSLEDCLHQALANRPELEARKLALDVLKRQIVVEKASTRPQVSVFAAYDLYSQPSQLAVKDNFAGYTVGVAASWTLFDGFLTLGRVRGLQAQFGAAEAQLVATRLQVETDVRVAFEQIRTAEDTLRPLGQNIDLAGKTLDLTTHNLDAGLNTTQLDVLQSRVDLTRARTTELNGRLALNVAVARIERAMGKRKWEGRINSDAKGENRRVHRSAFCTLQLAFRVGLAVTRRDAHACRLSA